MIRRQARASVRVMRRWKPHDPWRSCLYFTIRHHVANETDSQNDGALSYKQLSETVRFSDSHHGRLAIDPERVQNPCRKSTSHNHRCQML